MISSFHRPKTVESAWGLKKEFRDQAVYLAGGTFVNSMNYPLRPEHLISLEGLNLDTISVTTEELSLGALCTLEQILEHENVPIPLKSALVQMTSRNIRNRATLGGHIACGRSCSDLIPMLVALEAKVEISGSDRTELVPILDFNKKDSLITRVILPPTGRVAVCRNLRASASAKSILSVAVSLLPGNTLLDPIIAMGGMGRRVIRLQSVETQLNRKPLPSREDLEKLIQQQVEPVSCRAACVSPCSAADLRGSVGYRKYLAGVLVASTLHHAFDPAFHGKVRQS